LSPRRATRIEGGADLHRLAFLLGQTDGEELFGEPAP